MNANVASTSSFGKLSPTRNIIFRLKFNCFSREHFLLFDARCSMFFCNHFIKFGVKIPGSIIFRWPRLWMKRFSVCTAGYRRNSTTWTTYVFSFTNAHSTRKTHSKRKFSSIQDTFLWFQTCFQFFVDRSKSLHGPLTFRIPVFSAIFFGTESFRKFNKLKNLILDYELRFTCFVYVKIKQGGPGTRTRGVG